jgi:hypothetical protein
MNINLNFSEILITTGMNFDKIDKYEFSDLSLSIINKNLTTNFSILPTEEIQFKYKNSINETTNYEIKNKILVNIYK